MDCSAKAVGPTERFAETQSSAAAWRDSMPVDIEIGPPVLTINHGHVFMVSDMDGQVVASRNGTESSESELGVFAEDTRFVSHYASTVNGRPWTRLSSSATAHYAERIYLVNPPLPLLDREIPGGTLQLVITRAIGRGIHEDLDITNYSLTPAHFRFEITLRSDFADLFEVKAHRIVPRGNIVTTWDQERSELTNSYTNRDFQRRLIYRTVRSDSPPHYANGQLTFEVELSPGSSWHTCCYYIFVHGDRVREPMYGCPFHQVGETEMDRRQRAWTDHATVLSSSNELVTRLFRQCVEDMGALRLFDQDFGPDVWVPAAGVPWFVSIFGRDSLIASLQNTLVHAGVARGPLKKLAELQATEMDDWRDAEPGKIAHEIRFGELAHLKQIPHTPYYGTAEATPLYLIVLHEAWKWLGDNSLLREYRPVAERCLEWIDRYGDLDGDGFQEYRTRSSQGYENQGWKDAGDAVVYPDGSQVKQPKALCEMQGYVYDAWLRMAEVFEALGERDRATELRRKAADLQRRFEDAFWCEDLGFYAFGLGPDKEQIRTIASNPGHCLWSGIVRPERAGRVVKRLLQPDMWSGWGIRTLSANNPAYNPLSYQLGSVWPHDNGIIALGFRRYGFAEEANRVAQAICEAADHFMGYRLPELFAGIERQPNGFPVQYRGANVPQAWAAGAVFQFVQAILGLEADAPHGCLYVDPVLPEWLPDIALSKLEVGGSTLELRAWREGERTRWDASVQKGAIEVREKPYGSATLSSSTGTLTAEQSRWANIAARQAGH
jgi:glycogen debranching enzyme